MSGSALILRADALRLPLADESVDLIASSPPYFSLRSYRDGDEHYAGQIGSEPTPHAFLEALWAVMGECWRVLKPTGSCFINLGDKRSGSGGHNNSNLKPHTGGDFGTRKHSKARAEWRTESPPATRRNAPDRYNQAAFGRPKSKMLLPHRFAIGCEDGMASPCACPEMGGYRCPPGMHRSDRSCVLHGHCRTGWIMRQDVVWQKLNGLPESVTDRCRDSHEYLFHFTKEGRYFAAVDEVREPQSGPSVEHYGTLTAKSVARQDEHTDGMSRTSIGRDRPREYNPLGKLPGSVWPIASEPLIVSDEVKEHYDLPDHFAAFPTELVRRVILGWSPVGGVVMDPFSGTGTTAGVARALGRRGIGVDLSMDYSRLADYLVHRSRRFAKVVSRTNRENQGEMFGVPA